MAVFKFHASEQAGVHSSGGIHPYPQQLQILLDAAHGNGSYSVTNLGACGSTMLKKGDSPFWKRPQYTALIGGKWDIVTIMLGTNDVSDRLLVPTQFSYLDC